MHRNERIHTLRAHMMQHDVAAASGELQAPHLKEWPSHSSPSERAQ
jgi:hypothetical protein